MFEQVQNEKTLNVTSVWLQSEGPLKQMDENRHFWCRLGCVISTENTSIRAGGDSLLGGQDHLAQHGVHWKLGHPATKLKASSRESQ